MAAAPLMALALERADEEQWAKCVDAIAEAMQAEPAYFHAPGETAGQAFYLHGLASAEVGRPIDAIGSMRACLQRQPDHEMAEEELQALLAQHPQPALEISHVGAAIGEILAGRLSAEAASHTGAVCAALVNAAIDESQWAGMLVGMPDEMLAEFMAAIVAEQAPPPSLPAGAGPATASNATLTPGSEAMLAVLTNRLGDAGVVRYGPAVCASLAEAGFAEGQWAGTLQSMAAEDLQSFMHAIATEQTQCQPVAPTEPAPARGPMAGAAGSLIDLGFQWSAPQAVASTSSNSLLGMFGGGDGQEQEGAVGGPSAGGRVVDRVAVTVAAPFGAGAATLMGPRAEPVGDPYSLVCLPSELLGPRPRRIFVKAEGGTLDGLCGAHCLAQSANALCPSSSLSF